MVIKKIKHNGGSFIIKGSTGDYTVFQMFKGKRVWVDSELKTIESATRRGVKELNDELYRLNISRKNKLKTLPSKYN
jgi:formylmethanofuran dehydrogenase subunit C